MRMIGPFLREIIRYRGLLGALVARDLKVRYQALGLGYLWSLINPVLMIAVYTLVFSVILRSGLPGFALFLACGLVPWIWFQSSLVAGANAIVENGPILRRRYLPSQILPLVTVTSFFIHFLTTLPILLAFLVAAGRSPGPSLVLLPVLVLFQYVLTYGLALAVSALTVRFRDLELILSNLMLVLFFLTPILYSLERIPESVQPLLLLNPMTHLAHSYQNVLFFGRWPFWSELAALALMAPAALLLGISVFEARRWKFAEQV